MVDDTMEISSEHDQNTGDEDIDIDIDITAGQPDEDYILEDADSNIGLGDHFQVQPSSVVGNDDPMIDAASSYEMDDVDFIEDQNNLVMEHEAIAMSIVATDVSNNDSEHPGTNTDPTADDLPQESDLMWEHPEELEQDVDNSSLKQATEEYLLNNHEDHSADLDTKKNADNVSNPNATQNNPDSNRSPSHGPTDPAPIESSESSTDLKIRPAEESSNYDHSNPDDTTEQASGETDYETEPASLEDHDSLLLVHKAVVVYRTNEYALFSKSESDDPDSFFISDLSMSGKPLDELFGAIREVIHEDISDEDELSMSVEELGLEVDETSSSIKEVTLGQIISLHSQLLHNGGVETQRPLYFILSTRPNLSRRLAKLTAAAAEGKGLAELTPWYEGSESPADATALVEDGHEDDSHNERYEPNDFTEDVTGTDTGEATKTTQDDIEGFEPLTEESNAAHITATKNTPDNTPVEETSTTDTRQPPTLTTSNNSEHDDDGDLIDYEDEEFEMSKKGAAERPIELKTNEAFEKENEDLRRRSISLAAEDDLESFDGQAEDRGSSHESVQEAEDGAEYEDENNEEWKHYEEDAEIEDPPSEDPSSRDQAGPNEILDTNGETFGEEDAKNAELLLEEDELGLDDGESSENLDPSAEELQVGEGQNDNLEDFDLAPGYTDPEAIDSTLGFLDASESSTVASEKTLEIQTSRDKADTKLDAEDEDEIGYDDDDEEQPLADSGHTAQKIIISNGGPGKRSWADTDIEGPMKSKEAKRAKS